MRLRASFQCMPFRTQGQRRDRRAVAALPGFVLVAGSLLLAGCGGASPSGSEGTPSAGAEAEDSATPASNGAAPKTAESSGTAAVRVEGGRKFIDDIPYDVFFGSPLEVANDTRSVAAAAPSAREGLPVPAAPNDAPEAEPASADGASAAMGIAWNDLVSAAVLEDEMKRLRNQLAQDLVSVGKYNGNYKLIQCYGATIAALGGIALEHPDEVTWKTQAPHIRDLGMRIEESAQGLGRESYEPTQEAFEQLVALLDGGNPAGLGATPDERVPFAERADRMGLMKRMELAFEWMHKNVNTEAQLKAEQEKAVHEAALLAALAQVISTPEYTSAEEEDYKVHAVAMVRDSAAASRAAQGEDHATFVQSVEKINNHCKLCHQDYRFADDF